MLVPKVGFFHCCTRQGIEASKKLGLGQGLSWQDLVLTWDRFGGSAHTCALSLLETPWICSDRVTLMCGESGGTWWRTVREQWAAQLGMDPSGRPRNPADPVVHCECCRPGTSFLCPYLFIQQLLLISGKERGFLSNVRSLQGRFFVRDQVTLLKSNELYKVV